MVLLDDKFGNEEFLKEYGPHPNYEDGFRYYYEFPNGLAASVIFFPENEGWYYFDGYDDKIILYEIGVLKDGKLVNNVDRYQESIYKDIEEWEVQDILNEIKNRK